MNELTFLGSNITLVKAHNLRAILFSLLLEGGVSRVQLAKKTALSTTTITNIIAELLDQGIVIEEGTQGPATNRSVGRPRTALRLVQDARYAVGVHIGIGTLRVAVVDLCDQPLCNTITQYKTTDPAPQVLDQISTMVDTCIAQSGVDRQRIIGVGVGASGLVDYQSGINLTAPNLGWRNVPVREHLQSRLDLPVIVDNNVRAMALGEAFFGAARGIASLAFVYGRIGVGAGFVVDGKIFRGSSAGAGEIGHNILVPEDGKLCRCGNHGCLETVVSEPVIVEEARAIARANPKGLLAQTLHTENNARPIERIFQAARQGDSLTRAMIEKKAYYLGVALANLLNILNPELIILGGMFAQADDLILPMASKVMRQMAFAGLGDKVRVQSTSFGWRAGVLGASALALTQFFYQQTEGN